MCGIVGVLGHHQAAPILVDGLKKLEYRGYDSAGIATVSDGKLDRRRAMLQIPSLIKSYLRLGGFVGQGAFIDHKFNTTDVCLVLDTERMNDKQVRYYQGHTG